MGAIKAGAVAVPRTRDVHVIPTPRLGGVGMFAGVLAAIMLAANLPALTRGFAYTDDMSAVLAGGHGHRPRRSDRRPMGLDALTKFLGQVTAAGSWWSGVSWYLVPVPFGDIDTIVLDPSRPVCSPCLSRSPPSTP